MSSLTKGPGLYEFLTESELQQYFNAFKKDLKVHNVGQLKFVAEDDLIAMGMSKPEMRRLRKYFHKHYPQTYLSKFKKILLPKRDGGESVCVIINEENGDRPAVRVPSKHIIPSDAIVINKELGVGEFGVVQQGVWTNEDGDRIQVAIKCLSKERMQSQPMEFLKEAIIMHNIDSEHIVRLYGVVLDPSALMLVTELAPLRSLLECLKEPSLRVSFPVISLCHFCVQICDGMCYLENKRLIHRDLAARNILVFSKNKIKISDFGLSRALGVGKDYYQTNFNVNLKLPIAWCAPESINYLRFTSASDIWAYGVTLWEMFSYGFQPWAALTGQQILEAIDEPNFQRLEQPESCPKELYSIMLKCWQHDPNKRPKFVDLINQLPDLKPEQVQAVRENDESISSTPTKRDRLNYAVGDIITVLDKRPLTESVSLWKGVLNNGKSGYFNPVHTVAYLGTYVPSTKSAFTRGDGKNAYSSRRRLRTDMISVPQGDVKHTGHVGLDGAYFGDVGILCETMQLNNGRDVPVGVLQQGSQKYHQVPKQIVTPYKPSEDGDQSSTLMRASSDVSDRAPLLKKVGEKGKFGPASDQHWTDTASEDQSSDTPAWATLQSDTSGWMSLKSECSPKLDRSPDVDKQADHEYHEISDEEEANIKNGREEAPVFRSDSFDLGPSLMDEVFKALGGSNTPAQLPNNPPPPPLASSSQDEESTNVKNEIKEIASKFSMKDKRRQATVKPISANDERTLDSAIAMANELASRSMIDLDGSLENIHCDGEIPDSPMTPSSPGRNQKFTFNRFSNRPSPPHVRRHFSEEAASISDIQSSITEEAKEIYNSLIERPSPCEGFSIESHRSKGHLGTRSSRNVSINNSDQSDGSLHHNPLRMLRQGVTVRPKVRGNKHNLNNLSSDTIERNHLGRASSRDSSSSLSSGFDLGMHQTLPKGFKPKVGPATKPKPVNHNSDDSDIPLGADASSIDSDNPLPLPPRDRTRPSLTPNKPRHQRKHPLIIPGGVANSLLRGGGHLGVDKTDSPASRLLIQHTHNPQLETQGTASSNSSDGRASPRDSNSGSPSPKIPPAKPPRLFPNPSSLDNSFDSQVASEIDALDDLHLEGGGISPAGVPPPLFPGDAESTPFNLSSHPALLQGTPKQSSILDSTGTQDFLSSFGLGSLGARGNFKDNQTTSSFTDEFAPSGFASTFDESFNGSLYQSSDHVSCEDLLDFAMDRPDSRRTQGPAHGIQSDEVHLLIKVLKHEVSAQECVTTLDLCDWNIHRALKLLRLRLAVPSILVDMSLGKSTLEAFNWDVSKASPYLLATMNLTEDSEQV